ncbi:MAG: DUF4381 domain-containing protein [Thermomonas sp.]|uniref:DUF4381 domain-containing protein n=1 Tax=Thermomonas sp. TaxID=1971895 RepID=UPI001B717EF7|nr:DUF4381 domain-containing protein [Thermomonas sp.]MBK6333282.1 DUF4381 domain-containing protein [Thermomonas sp.]MBP7158901.1 DUF4381 domain-containing protein [Thermomonas sp.]MBP8615529.1 DUF4381 domain-containing protein [Thermomonas sp.]MBP8647761.1 DUF4381 domain-containing protein [Thermomonas sp.]MBP9696797.1 DUF4381 domain-containing protein [Thermomonas sp.]
MTPLPLRDVHEGVAPAWWPPAPGWWLLLGAIVIVATLLGWRAAAKRRRREAILRLFDDALAHAGTPAQQVAAMSELLRRAARRKHAGADRLLGDEWLRFLDEGMPRPVFSTGAGRLLGDGGFRPQVAAQECAVLRDLARERYLRWMRA